MHRTNVHAIPLPVVKFRWLMLALIMTLTGMAVAPIATIRAQTGSSASNAQTISIVPETALFYAQVDLSKDSSQMQTAMALLDRAGFSEFTSEDLTSEVPPGASAAIVVTSLSSASDVDIEGVASNPLAAAGELDQGGYALILSGDAPQDIYDQLSEEFDSTDGDVATTEYNGTTITTFTPTDTEFDSPSAIAMVGDYVIQAARAEDIQPLIDTAAGTTPTLADNEQFQTISGMLPQERLALGFLNGPGVIQSLQASSPEIVESLDERTSSLLNSWSAFSVSAEESGFRVETRSVSNGQAFEAMTPLSGDFLGSVPADSLMVINGTNIDATGIVTSVALLLAQSIIGVDPFATPAAGTATPVDEAAIFEQTSSLLGFNIKTDFIDHLLGEFGLAISVNGSIASLDTPPDVSAILFSDVDNAGAVQDVMSKVAFIVGAGLGDSGTVNTREVAGSQVHVVDISESGIAQKVEFGVVNDQWVVSVGDGLDEYLAGAESPLAEDPNFQAVMEHLPTEYGSLAYVNLPQILTIVTDVTSGMTANIEDADPSCGDYATQADAQAAYDADQFGNFLLDQDFDGQACEDFFNPAQSASPEASTNPYPNVIGLATVSTQEEGVNGTSTFLLIGGE